MTQQDDFLDRLQSAFNIEADEHLQAISAGLLDLEKSPVTARIPEMISTIFREAHSLKGAARAVNLAEIEVICQAIEGVFSLWKRTEVTPSAALLDPLHHAVNTLTKLLPSSGNAAAHVSKEEISNLLADLGTLGGEGPAAPYEAFSLPPDDEIAADEQVVPMGDEASSVSTMSSPEPITPHIRDSASTESRPNPSKRPLSETLRISTFKLDALLLKTEELLAAKLTVDQRSADLRSIMGTLHSWEKEWGKISSDLQLYRRARGSDASGAGASAGLNPDSGPLLPLAAGKVMDFLDWNQNLIGLVQSRLGGVSKAADQDRRSTARMVDSLLEDAKKLMMLPFSTLLAVFPKLVRDLSRDEGKEVELVIHGGEVEIDKRILEEMKDPLIHLVRNCVDHGIEIPSKRTEANKPPRGTIEIRVSQVEGNKVEILIVDDGAGINPHAVRTAAIRQGTVSSEDARKLTDREAIRLAFEPEVSTSPIITEISGRGLGLAIVKEKVERLGGRVEVETHVNVGTSFRLLLPLTLATFRGILTQSGGQTFVVPTASVDRVARIRRDDIKTVENRETIRLTDRTISLVRLDDVLQLPRVPDHDDDTYLSVIVLGIGDSRIAFSVDAVLNEQEVLVKPLGKPLLRVRNIAGATVLGSGKAVLILNVMDLMKSAAIWKAAPSLSREAAASPAATRRSVLVVEDSITARMLIKNILESAGYGVKTAVDGMDAFAILRSENIDLVVSDIEMPRMNGFDLTSRIRADKRLADLPVVLVTALASQEDRERGVDVGANAYIVKSNFNQSNLLDVVRQLV